MLGVTIKSIMPNVDMPSVIIMNVLKLNVVELVEDPTLRYLALPTYMVVPGLDFETKMSVMMIKNDDNCNYDYELAWGASTLLEHLTRNPKI